MVLGPTARRWLPYLNFTVAISALGFQTGVLYPWHEELDREFKKLREENKEQLQVFHEAKLRRLEELETRFANEKTHKVCTIFASDHSHADSKSFLGGHSNINHHPSRFDLMIIYRIFSSVVKTVETYYLSDRAGICRYWIHTPNSIY